MADDDDRRPDPAGAAARSMAQLAQQMREMADRMLAGGGLPGWPTPGAVGQSTPAAIDQGGAAESGGSGSSGSAPTPALPGMAGFPATPATMSARQMQAIVDDLAARRAQVQALVVQLNIFDEQLGTLETSLRPLLQWLRTWSDLEGAVTDFWTPRPPR
jgi:hypothetical protein